MTWNVLSAEARTFKNITFTGAGTDPYQRKTAFGSIFAQGTTQGRFIPYTVTPTTDWTKS